MRDFFNLIIFLIFKRLHDFFLLEPLKNRLGDVITHGAREREGTTGAVIACFTIFLLKYHNSICKTNKQLRRYGHLPLPGTVCYDISKPVFKWLQKKKITQPLK